MTDANSLDMSNLRVAAPGGEENSGQRSVTVATAVAMSEAFMAVEDDDLNMEEVDQEEEDEYHHGKELAIAGMNNIREMLDDVEDQAGVYIVIFKSPFAPAPQRLRMESLSRERTAHSVQPLIYFFF
jgi:hypothetical protein